MAPTTRLHFLPFELNSILSRQTRLASRPQYPLLFLSRPRCRTLHLYKAAHISRRDSTLGQHKILPFNLYHVPNLSESNHKITLITKPGGEELQKELSLEDALALVQPGQVLYQTDEIPKSLSQNWEKLREDELQNKFNRYAIYETGKRRFPIASKKVASIKFVHLAALKEIHCSLSSTPDYTTILLDRTYQFLNAGHPVEFCLRLRGSKVKKADRWLGYDFSAWYWMHQNFPHLRPDFILKGMPEGAYFKVSPWSDGNHLQWVMAMPTADELATGIRPNMDRRLGVLKKRVQDAMDSGKQSQLPASLRQKLIDAGIEAYSLQNGEPKGVTSPGKIIKSNAEGQKIQQVRGRWDQDRWLVPRTKDKSKENRRQG
ncbi:uncharacterized protein BDR25DRAFT_296627 [Lindgomyces ingoldianus]|uniref:Uncharacterized protein n=1 Tax=Lindgomyces ingoldianus TaxID=673940 RepID=A0ACB6QCJ4_9PLEO|nr:uncharacterized protein BDR25DRAFT_296627 [Lindgomyces ingoldianus]KAF2464649.1 hypothetical protein BDR25DRAFT_296627 [Lindgomyces ingoldianus]